jgi:hypothetical protein
MPPKQGQQAPPPLAGDEEEECVSNKEVHAMMKVMTELFTKNQQKVDACCMSYLGLTTIVEPLNVVWMVVSTCLQANLCHKISTHQIVVTSSIDDGANVAIFDNEENLE